MARHLPATARIFTRKGSLWSRIFSGFLLTLSLLATLAGIGTAVYLGQPYDRPAPPALAATVAPGAGDAAIAPAPPPPSPEARREPAAGSTTPQAARPASPVQTAKLEAPAATSLAAPASPPAAAAIAPERRYWVEYGVFAGPRYAERLKDALAAQGLAAVVVATHGADGRKLIRVRSAPLADLGAARAAAESAEHSLALATLIHRLAGSPEVAAAPEPAMPQAARSGGYWVQFGAFPHYKQAMRLHAALARSGVETAVSVLHAVSGKALFAVRSSHLPDRDSALALARRGQDAAKVDFLIGQSASAANLRRQTAAPLQRQSG